MTKRYLLAVVGLESNTVVPLSFYGFWLRRTAVARAASFNDDHKDDVTRFAVYDRCTGKLLP